MFRAGGHESLARVSATVSSDPRLRDPLVVAYARLVVTGGDGHQLHEEIIQAGGVVKGGRLERLDVRPLSEAVDLPVDGASDGAMTDRIVALHKRLVDELDAALQKRARDRERSLGDTVETRMREEDARSRAVLEELRDHIEQALRSQVQQLSLFSTDEERQFRLDREFLAHRLAEIPRQIGEEAAQLARRFADPEARIFPIAVEYRIPVSVAGR